MSTPFPQPAAPVSRDTYPNAISKNYDGVVFVGGQGRRVFDAEMNEAQEIAAGLRQQTLSALIGNNDYDNNTGTLIGTGGLVTTGPTAGSIYYNGGYICAGGQIIRLGNPAGQTALTIFQVTDNTSAQAFVYVDAWNGIVNSTVDPTIIDPAYSIETAQRSQLNFTVQIAKFPTGFGGTTWASYMAANVEAGHTWTLLASVNNTHYPTIETGDITPGATSASFGSLLAQVNSDIAALEATLTAGLASKPTYVEIPYATRNLAANLQVVPGFSTAIYSTWLNSAGSSITITPPVGLGIPSNAKRICLTATFQPLQASGNLYAGLAGIPAITTGGTCLLWANNRDFPGLGYFFGQTFATQFRVPPQTVSSGDGTDAGSYSTSVYDFLSRVDSQTVELATGAAVGQTFTSLFATFSRTSTSQNWGLSIRYEGYWV